MRHHSRLWTALTLGMIAIAFACSRSKSVNRPADSVVIVGANTAPTEENSQPVPEPCFPLWPQSIRLSGTLSREIKYGPPGYGEDPKKDIRVEVFTLVLEKPINVCADTSSTAPQPIARDVTRLQLTEHVSKKDLTRNLGLSVDVFGTLRRQVWPSDYTDALIRVDSIPAIHRELGKMT